MQETQERQPTQVFLPQKSHGQWSLVCYSPKGCKELDTTEQLSIYIYTYIYIYSFALNNIFSFCLVWDFLKLETGSMRSSLCDLFCSVLWFYNSPVKSMELHLLSVLYSIK